MSVDKGPMEEFYSQITFEMLYSRDFDKELFDFYQRRRNCFIVMGAAGRTSLSRLMSDGKMYLNREVMEHPFFIAHF
ncbi:hypothetical protein LL912_02605 [Niabella sp. CC-SYL272]|uniref:hypothetical protein n=1 Tax=Niabella agricola TaxID=2891571 RepID=UPI001F476F59|nr:hypothetical protein [Niabella agricola]MCF3107662.1 hypothetical protein [Niabella agricola]